jgi:hypothetical protein
LAEALVVGVGLLQFVPAFCVLCFVLAPVPALVLALALALADALDVAVPLALLVGLALLAVLALPLDSPGEGLTVEPGEAPDAVDVADVVGVGLDEAGVGVAVGDDCGHDAIGDGRWCRAAVVEEYTPPPPAAAWPLWPGAAGLVAPLELIPSKADATDELSACRSGGTEAMTTPTANTAQATAIAGLIRPTRQSRCGPRRDWPPAVPLRRAFQRRTISASTPVLADAACTVLARAVLARARIRSRPSGRGSTWSAAACSARCRNSSKSCPGDGLPSWRGRTLTPAPGRHAGRSCPGPYDF